MPNIKSAKKRLLTSAKRREGNVAIRSRITTTRQRMMKALADKDRERSDRAFATFCSVLDKAAKRGAIKQNNADRRKSRARLRLDKTFAAA